MISLEAIAQKLDVLTMQVERLTKEPKPGLTKKEFAKAVRVSPRTVGRWIKDGKLSTKKGRVPYSELVARTSR